MASIKAYGSFVPFTLHLEDYAHVNVVKYLLSLRFNLQIKIMYVKYEMYHVDGDILEIISL